MIIKKVDLKNIRSHKDTVIDFDKGITVLSGRTGCGKSTILIGINYALFGGDNNLTNNSVLRRGASKGFARIIFERNGHEYELMRGLKRSGDRIITDPDNLWIKEDDKRIPMLARSNELNDKIIELLDYPVDVKPKELFEITSYAKQDEIRKLIDLTSGEREKYIDRVLQLSKYELTYQNMRQLLNNLGQELSRLRGRIEGLGNVQGEIEIKESELNKLIIKRDSINNELSDETILLNQVKGEHESLKSEVDDLGLKKTTYDNKQGLINGFKQEINQLRNELSEDSPTKSWVNELKEQSVKLRGELVLIESEIKKLGRELESFNELKGKCPTCHQEVSNDYANGFKNDLNKSLRELMSKQESTQKELNKLSKELLIEEEKEAIIKSNKLKQERINELLTKIKVLRNDLSNIKPLISELSIKKEAFKKVNDEFIKHSSRISGLRERLNGVKQMINRVSDELAGKHEELKYLLFCEERFRKLGLKEQLLKRLREDIRSIRSAVRTRFLEDFRHEFQRKFEDIRRDDDYSVEIGINYEPLAYAGNEEVSIDSLSGGEKTSVALAYRLALSEIAARVSSVKHNEVLMLDEPTTGFDRRDISVLPEALRSIRTIPQIIIVSHEDELKEAADKNHQIKKISGTTIIE